MKMPLAEIIDRLSINLLKKYVGGQQNDHEIEAYQQAMLEYKRDGQCRLWLLRLCMQNALIWSAESDIRQGREGELGHAEVGRRAIDIRTHNAGRIKIKAEISQAVGEFEDKKSDHASD